MNNPLHWLLTYLLNSLWQLPLIAVVSLLAMRLMAPVSWRARNLLAIAALILAILLPAWSASTSTLKPGESVAVSVLSLDQDGPSTASVAHRPRTPRRYSSSLHLAPAISRSVAFIYLAFMLGSAALLAWKWRGTRKLLRHAITAELNGELGGQWQRWKQAFQVEDVRLLTTAQIAGPVTPGLPPRCGACSSRLCRYREPRRGSSRTLSRTRPHRASGFPRQSAARNRQPAHRLSPRLLAAQEADR